MIIVHVDYATPSVFDSTRDESLLGIAPNTRRPVRFVGTVRRDIFLLRLALRTLGEVVWSDDSWLDVTAILDPVITVHRDRIFFEAFSQDQSTYGMVILTPDMFDIEGEVSTGTTNVDFTAWLWAALGELRSSRKTRMAIDPQGFEVKTAGAGGRYEQKVELPISWVRGFLQLQGAMAMPGTVIETRPVDLLAALRYLRYTKAKVSPRALRYEFTPGEDARLVLEPWEHVVRLRDASHNYSSPRTIRTWGRRRLRLIEPLLPFADGVEIFLKGRALPSFYAVKMKGITFLLGLSGWTGQRWTESTGFDLLAGSGGEREEQLTAALEILRQHVVLSVDGLSEGMSLDLETSSRLLTRLCRRGQAVYDVMKRAFRHRELFENPVDEAQVYPPSLQLERALQITEEKGVSITDVSPQETRKIRKMKTPDGEVTREIVYRDWQISGQVEGRELTEIVLNDTGRIIFGTCSCSFFKENLLNRGPCEHMIAVLLAGKSRIRDESSSNSLP